MNFVEALNLFGLTAKEIPCITGSGAPTSNTQGAIGSLYLDTATGTIYACIGASGSSYTWIAGSGGEDGVGVQSVTQTTTSTEDGGVNVITVTLTNGQKSTFQVRNGTKGDPYTLTSSDKASIVTDVINALPTWEGGSY